MAPTAHACFVPPHLDSLRMGKPDVRAREVVDRHQLPPSLVTTKADPFDSAARLWRAPLPQGGGSWCKLAVVAASWAFVCCKGAMSELLGSTIDATQVRRCCYTRPPPLLQEGTATTTGALCRCYMRPPRLLHQATTTATCGCRGTAGATSAAGAAT
jgi:hypothetical protein